MGYKRRLEIIQELQELRNTKIVVHTNSDRRVPTGHPVLPGFRTKLGTEAQPFFYQALRQLGSHPQLDLFLYTGGGQTDSVWPLVSLFREFGDEFNVLVPYKAHSAGTLVCLGANTIVMANAAELSPVDPQTGNQFNPVDEIDKKTRRAISVEDVAAYFELANDPSKASEDDESDPCPVDTDLAFRILAQRVHPLALGNVNRSHKQIRELAKRLLALHIADSDTGNEQIAFIVNALTQGRYSHTDILNRREAKELIGPGVVKFASAEEQRLMWLLFESYADALSLWQTYVFQVEMGDKQQADVQAIGAFIETEKTSYVYRAACSITQRSTLPDGFQLQLQPGQLLPLIPGLPRELNVEVSEMGWAKNEEGT